MSLILVLVGVNTDVFASTDFNNSNSANFNVVANNSHTIISEPMSFDELCYVYSQDMNISIDEAANRLGKDKLSINKIQLYGFNYGGNTYRTLSQQFDASSNGVSFYPTMKFYCETSESNYFAGIMAILDTQMVQSYNYKYKPFSGNVYVNLENGSKIHYIVNGAFYDEGTTTTKAGLVIGIGESTSVGFEISYSSNLFRYYYGELDLRYPY